jgi:hypothetical protein
VDASKYSIWEVETDDDGIVIRLIDSVSENKPRNALIFNDIRIEFISAYQKKELMALLGFFDEMKKNKKPFLQSLHEFLSQTNVKNEIIDRLH